QQRERQTELLLKFLLRSRCVFRNSKQHHARFLEGRVAVAKAARFLGASRRIGFGIEIKHHGLAAEIFQGNLFAVLVRRTEVWGFIIDLHMEFSPRRTLLLLHRRLYRNGMFAVTLATLILLAGSWLVAQAPITQYGRKPAVDKGPRALGLIQLSPKGNKGRLTPIAIMMDGKFYDAGSYKATPVPMALDFDIVYEGFRTGVSQGVFTITQPGQLNHVWIAEGTWLPAGMRAPEKSKKYAAPVIEDKEGPPVLHRRSEKAASDGGADSKDKGKDKDQQKPAGPPASAPPAPETAKAPAPPETAKTSAADEPIEDPNRPRLRRGKPDSTARREPFTTFDALTDTTPGTGKADATAKDAAALPQIVIIPAISDAGGPDPRPYTYDLKPAE